ncbi:BCCT family transporter [Oceanobacillus oncorhynchi subsp. incaldanensis]|uniref:BCCT family transporter n=1 Tax=Oceanobacillus oncorhynchi TaxID=545501 RepID=UPI001B196909|nr:BCCT family transporter [Oceanobacillus oncorhynchi]GIO18649.1 BCCT family transporter [Oceanobacillus oncorhynchi subsp. incaldanensis]
MQASNKKKNSLDLPTFLISGGALILFVIAALVNADFVANMVDTLFGWSATYFGIIYQIVILGTFFIALILAFSKYGKIRLGNIDKPEMSTFKWISIIMCTLLAGGGVFWAAAEPLSHFLEVPPHFSGIENASPEAVVPALAMSFVDWGFLSWAILGTLGTIVLMYSHYHKGMPLKPRSLLYPIFGEKVIYKSAFGTIVDSFAIISVAAGTIGPIGFLGLQAGYGLSAITNIPDTLAVHITIIILLVVAAAISAVSGLHRGIQLLSSFNVILAVALIIGVLILGPGYFIFNHYLEAFGLYVNELIPFSTYRGDEGWLNLWTVFFFAWFIGYGPMMAVFSARISRGRTIREIIVAVAIIAPVVSTIWFAVIGGTGIFQELELPGSISTALNESGQPAAMMAITEQLPLGTIFSFLFLLATIIFVLTTTDSMSLTISMAISGNGHPPRWLRAFFAMVMGLVAIVLVSVGENSVNSLQSFIVVTAVPVVFLLLTTFWTAPKACKDLYENHKKETLS